jgi:hypothetical protein
MPFRPDLSQYEKHPKASIEENLAGIARELNRLGISVPTKVSTPSAPVVPPTPAVTSHPDLTERDAEDQHPISAITGLQDALDAEVSARTSAVTAEAVARADYDAYLLSLIGTGSGDANWDGGSANTNYGGTTSIDGGNA